MRVINFNAGPAGLPQPALERAREELLDFQGSGMSIMEHSHRGKDYEAVHNEAISLLTELLGIPATHQVLFLQGGASQQFAQVPMNFLTPETTADYLMTGEISSIIHDNARAVKQIALAVSQQDQGVVLIFEAMNELSTMMEDTERQLETTKSAAVALEGVSRRLTDVVTRYQT